MNSIKKLQQLYEKRGIILFDTPQIRRYKGLRLPLSKFYKYVDIMDYTEILFALFEVSNIFENKEILELGKNILDDVINLFELKGFLASFYIPILKIKFPMSEPISAMIIEALLDYYEITNNKDYLNLAIDLTINFTNTPIFKSYHILPSAIPLKSPLKYIPKLKNTFFKSELVKNNSSFLFALISLIRITRDKFWKKIAKTVVLGIENYFNIKRGLYQQIIGLGKKRYHKLILSTNFAMIDIFCDLFYYTRDDWYLYKAIDCAKEWIKIQDKQTGLFPDSYNGAISYLDGNTDFIVALLKLWELTGEELFKKSAEKALEGIIKYHRIKNGYTSYLNIRELKPINNIIDTRYVSLFMKPLLIFANNWRIYSEGRTSIFRDR